MVDRRHRQAVGTNVTLLARNRRQRPAEGPLQVRIHLLGRMRVVGEAGEDISPASKKTKALLAYLALAKGEWVARSRIAGLLWDQSTESLARDHLRHALSELAQATVGWRLERRRHSVRLNLDRCWVDVFDNPNRPELLDDLSDVSTEFDQWLLAARARYESECGGRLEATLDDLVSQTAAPRLRIEAARTLLVFAPAHQRALRCLMTALVDIGDPAQALDECARFETLLAASHDLELSEVTIALREEIRHKSPRAGSLMVATADRAVATPVGELVDRDPVRQPSIAVLPLRDISPRPNRSYFAEGLTDDVVEALSHVPDLFVISRLSAAAFKTQNRPPQEIGAVLGVRYILSGTVRLIDDRVRLNVELVDTSARGYLWSDRFDRRTADVLDLQDELAAAITRALAPHVRLAELKRARLMRPEHLGAYHFLLHGQECMHDPSRETFERARAFFEEAIKRAPEYAPALSWRSYWHLLRVGQEWSSSSAEDTTAAERFAQLARECDPSDPMAIAIQGHVAGYLHKNLDLAFSYFDRALAINPNNSRAWLWNSYAHSWAGKGEDAVAKIKQAILLSPFDPLRASYSAGAAIAHLAAGQYDEAANAAARCIRENPTYTSGHKLRIIALSLQGRLAQARAAVQPMLALDPEFSVERYRNRFPGSDGPLADPFCSALARAGVRLRSS